MEKDPYELPNELLVTKRLRQLKIQRQELQARIQASLEAMRRDAQAARERKEKSPKTPRDSDSPP
jgi:hypothetical protein